MGGGPAQGERKGLVFKSVKRSESGEGERVPEEKKLGNGTIRVPSPPDTSRGCAESGGTSLCCFPPPPDCKHTSTSKLVLWGEERGD